jgi:hypothetical protein
MDLVRVNHQIAQEQSLTHTLQAEWQRVASPTQIQKLAQATLGMNDTPVVELSSFEVLPRRGENPLDSNPVVNASVSAPATDGNLHFVVANRN